MPIQETQLRPNGLHKITMSNARRVGEAPVAKQEAARALPPPTPLWRGRGGMQTNAVFRPASRAYLAFNGASALMRMPMTIILNQKPRCPKGTRWVKSIIKKVTRRGCQKQNGIWHGPHKSTYPNGNRKAEGTFVNGKMHGPWKGWHHNGKKRLEATFVNGKPHGLLKKWHTNGKKKAETTFVNGKLHGLVKKWHPNGKKAAEATFVNGKLHGLVKKWHPNGKKAGEATFVNGKPHGLVKTWHPNGNKGAEARFLNGKEHGLHKEWHPNGKKKAEERYVNGQMHGLVKTWHLNGKKHQEARFVRGRQHGSYKTWHPNGKKQQEGKYVNGKEHGLRKEWHTNSKKKVEGKYINGKKHGPWKGWHINGQMKAEGRFVKGKQHGSYKTWHPNGKKQQEGKYVNGKEHGLYKIWHTNGKKQQEGKYVNGKMHGTLMLWDNHGALERVINYVRGVLHGRYWIRLANGGTIEGYHRNGKEHGVVVTKDQNGKVLQRCTMAMGSFKGCTPLTVPATVTGSWISAELKRVYGTKRWKAGKGVDLNGNGKLEKNEKIATYNTNTIPGNDKRVIGDWTDWLAFYRANHSAINHRAIHAKTGNSTSSIFLWAGKFKTTNPLHIITSIESPVVKSSQVLKAYKKTWAIIARARKIPVKGSTKLKLAKAKLLAVRTAMVKSGIKLKTQYKKPLFVENMVDGVLDCDTSSFVILAEAHEKGWPVFGVFAPSHFFVRWDEDDRRSRIKFNMDTMIKERFPTDRKYKKSHKISPRAVSAGVYLKNHKLSALVSTAITNRAQSYLGLGKIQEAIRDFSEAIKLNPTSVRAYNNRGAVYGTMDKHAVAIRDYSKAIKLDPKYANAFYNRGVTYGKQSKYAHAIKDYTEVIKLKRKYANAYYNRGTAYAELGKYTLAIKDYTEAIKLKRKYADAYYNRGLTYGKQSNHAHAIKDYTEAIKLDRKHLPAHLNRGLAYVHTKQYAAAIGDFKKALSLIQKSDPKYTLVRDKLADIYFKRGKARFKTGNYAGAASDFRKLRKLYKKHTLADALIKRCMQFALRQVLIVAVRKKYGASTSESSVKTVLKTQKWNTLKQLGISADIQKAFGKLGYKQAAKSSYYARKLLKKTLKNWTTSSSTATKAVPSRPSAMDGLGAAIGSPQPAARRKPARKAPRVP